MDRKWDTTPALLKVFFFYRFESQPPVIHIHWGGIKDHPRINSLYLGLDTRIRTDQLIPTSLQDR